MSVTSLFLLAGMALLAMTIEPLSNRLRLPFSVVLVAIGFGVSELVTGLGIDTGLRYEGFVGVVLHGLLPVLVFQSAFSLSLHGLMRDLLPVLLLAIPFMLLAAAITGIALYWGIDHPGFPLAAALLAGVIVSATDPVSVVALFERLDAPERLRVLLEGESLLNDATVIVIFGVLVSFMLEPAGDLPWAGAIVEFLRHFFGGAALGVAYGTAAAWLYRQGRRLEWFGFLGLGAPALLYVLAHGSLGVSGVVAVLCTGLLMGEAHRRHPQAPAFIHDLWQVLGYAANALVFLLAGMTITVGMFSSHWLAMLIGIAAATVARALVIHGLLPLALALPGQQALPRGHASILQWGGVRGAVALALALSLPTAIDNWYSIQSIVYGVVMFTLFAQAPLMQPLLRAVMRRQGADTSP